MSIYRDKRTGRWRFDFDHIIQGRGRVRKRRLLPANIAMNNWGEEVFAEMARGFVFNRYSALYAASDGK